MSPTFPCVTPVVWDLLLSIFVSDVAYLVSVEVDD